MAKYIDLPNLKENLTNFLNKKINPIYAKKTEIPSNVSELNNDKSYQTAEEVGQAITNGVARIVAGAPEDFDTLKEMSDWISSHETSAAAMNSAISDNSVAIANHTSNSDIHVTKAEKTKWDNKVDSVEGKTLSNNNFLYKYKDTLDKMPTTYQYKTHYNKEDGTFNMVSINAGSQGTDPQTFQKYTLPSNYKDIFDGVNSKIEDLALNGVYSNKVGIDQVNSNLDTLEFGKISGTKNLFEDEIKWMENISITRGTKSVSDGKITLTATSNDCYTDHDEASWKNNGIKTISCKPNTTYTFSWEYEGDLEGAIYIFENGSTNNMRDTINKAHKLSITTSADAEFLTIRVGVRDSGTSITYWNFQLEEGDTTTSYEPYIPSVKMLADEVNQQKNDLSNIKDIETTTLTTTSGTATLYKLGKMRHLVLNNATFSSTTVLTSTDASVGTLYFRAEVLFNSGDDLEGGSASFEDICISGSNMWNATRTATGASPVAVKGATGSATWMVQ